MSEPLSVSSDRAAMDVDVIHDYLSRQSYWAAGIPRPLVEESIRNSLCFGVFEGKVQVGFARVITDYATYGYIADVFVLESHRGRGLARMLMEAIMSHPALAPLRRWQLVTRDAHRLYGQFGFHALAAPERHMEKTVRNPYGAPGPSR